jgi:hypothetical protein
MRALGRAGGERGAARVSAAWEAYLAGAPIATLTDALRALAASR